MQLPAADAESLISFLEDRRRNDEPVRIRVDIARQSIQWPGGANLRFSLDARRRKALLEGLDEIGLTLAHEPEIAAWQARDRLARPWIWQAAV